MDCEIRLSFSESLHQHLKNAAQAEGVSINQFISLAIAEKLSAFQTYVLIAKRAARGSLDKFLDALAAIPAAAPAPDDELPPGYQRK